MPEIYYDVRTFYSSFTRPSVIKLSGHEEDERMVYCANEVEFSGFSGCGYVCLAHMVRVLGIIKFYKPCGMDVKGKCPINQYRESPLPNP